MVFPGRDGAGENITCKRYADRLIRLHAKKCDQHRADDCCGAHSGEAGAKTGAEAGENTYENCG